MKSCELERKNNSVVLNVWICNLIQHLFLPLCFTNFYQVTNRGAKPHLVEMGPYVYEQRVHRKNITFNDNNGTVTFEQTRTYHFVPEKSNGSEADVVCTISAPAAGANGMVCV